MKGFIVVIKRVDKKYIWYERGGKTVGITMRPQLKGAEVGMKMKVTIDENNKLGIIHSAFLIRA